MAFHFFISRAGEDSETAKWIAAVLEAEGHTTTLQDLNFKPGQSFLHQMTRRASESLLIAERNQHLVSIGLAHVSLGRALPPGSAEAADHLEQAVNSLRQSGALEFLAVALLARGTPRDLEEVFRIATRSGMRLHLADYHLAKGNLKEAEALIQETGYHRRDPELAALRRNAGLPA